MLNVGSQFKHRVARLYPPYMAVLLVALLFAFMKNLPYDFIAHLLSAQNFLWMVSDYKSPMQPLTAHTWTLSIEVWTGLFWLFLLNFLPKKWFKISMFLMLLVGIIYRITTIVYGANAFVVSLCPIAHFDAFACGSLLAICLKEKILSLKVGFLVVVGIAGIIACVTIISSNNQISIFDAYGLLSSSSNYLNNWFTGNIYMFISLFTMGLLGIIILFDEKRNGASKRWLLAQFIALGNASYALYLFHWPILVVLKRFVGKGWLLFVMTLLVSVLACYIFSKLLGLLESKFSRKNAV